MEIEQQRPIVVAKMVVAKNGTGLVEFAAEEEEEEEEEEHPQLSAAGGSGLAQVIHLFPTPNVCPLLLLSAFGGWEVKNSPGARNVSLYPDPG